MAGVDESGIYTSTDRGDSWRKLPGAGLPDPGRVISLAVDAGNAAAMHAGAGTDVDPGIYRSSDGVPDRLQPNVASLPSTAGYFTTIAAPEGTRLKGVAAVANPSPAGVPPGISFPFGFFRFSLAAPASGGGATATMFLPSAAASPPTMASGRRRRRRRRTGTASPSTR